MSEGGSEGWREGGMEGEYLVAEVLAALAVRRARARLDRGAQPHERQELAEALLHLRAQPRVPVGAQVDVLRGPPPCVRE